MIFPSDCINKVLVKGNVSIFPSNLLKIEVRKLDHLRYLLEAPELNDNFWSNESYLSVSLVYVAPDSHVLQFLAKCFDKKLVSLSIKNRITDEALDFILENLNKNR